MDKIYRYFSQYGEDFLLWEFFDFKPRGFFVDIGAFDGIHLSNSYSFELIGWNGICVEPHPFYFKLCQENRPASKCFNVACVRDDNKGKLTLNIDNTGLFSSIQNIGNDENIIGHYGELKEISLQVEKVEVNSTSLNSLLSTSISNDTKIDFISIDVEGAELEVLKGFDLVKYKPHLICIETNNDKLQEQITSYLKQFGYLWARKTNANSFFVTNENDYKKINNIKINCAIEKQMHPLGADYTNPSYLIGLALYEGANIYKKYHSLIHYYKEQVQSYQKKIKIFDGLLKEHCESIDKQNIKINNLSTQLKENKECLHLAEENIQFILNSYSYRVGKKIILPFSLMKQIVKTAFRKN